LADNKIKKHGEASVPIPNGEDWRGAMPLHRKFELRGWCI